MLVFSSIAVLNFALYFWSVFGVFKKVHHDKTPMGYRFVQIFSLSFWIISTYRFISKDISVDSGTLYCMIGIQLISLFLFVFASYVNRKQKLSIVYSKDVPLHVQKTGPYRFVRHPFYLSYILCYLSVLVVTRNIALTTIAIGLFTTYWVAANQEEEKFLNSNLKNEYLNYKKHAGMFYPKFW